MNHKTFICSPTRIQENECDVTPATVANAPGGLSFSLQLQIPLFCLLNVGEISIMKAKGSGLVQSIASVNLYRAPRPRDSGPHRGEFISLAHSLENKNQEFCLPLISAVG